MQFNIDELIGEQKPRAVLIDLDGTLLEHNTGEKVMADTKDLLHELGKDTIISIASGRYHDSVRSIANATKLRGPHISENGARIFEPVSDQTLSHTPLSRDVAHGIFEIISHNTAVAGGLEYFCAEGKTFFSKSDLSLSQYDKITAITVEVKSSVAGYHLTQASNAFPAVTSEISRGMAGEYYVVFTHVSVNKGSAALKMAQILDIQPSDMAVIGDGPNDISMFDVVPLSIAMGNASTDVKEHAKYVTAPQSEDGLNVALRLLLNLA